MLQNSRFIFSRLFPNRLHPIRWLSCSIIAMFLTTITPADARQAVQEKVEHSIVEAANPGVKDLASMKYGYRTTPIRRSNPDPLELQFELSPQVASAGDEVTLAITMELNEPWHTYGLKKHLTQVSTPTTLKLSNFRNAEEAGEFQSDPSPVLESNSQLQGVQEFVHHGRTTWTIKLTALADGPVGIDGSIRYQICDTSCMPPKTINFSLGEGQAPEALENATPLLNSTINFPTPPSEPAIADVNPAPPQSLFWNLLLAFAGGLILNVTPCVLPVLAIKVLGFAHQAGESRGRILALNSSYAIGVIGVFLLLATLAVFAGMVWGGLFQKEAFKIVMTMIVFTMALSLLGIFEIPIPGMIGPAGHKEGLLGAMFTGVFATLLATPCTGPFMGATLAWSVKQPPHVVYLVWGTMGLGMAAPYVALGFFPKAISLLPKPGVWMIKFKEVCGFLLLATVIFLLTTIGPTSLIPSLITMLVIGFVCWLFGQEPERQARGDSKMRKLIRNSLAFAAVPLAAALAFSHGPELPWQPFSESTL